MPRFMNPLANFTALLCVLAAAHLAPLIAQRIGSRQPDVSDWSLFHRKNDEYWARRATAFAGWDPVDHSKLSISASDVRNIRLAAGIADDEPADAILNLEGRGMRPDQYLLLTSKSDGCLKVAVYARGLRHFTELWSSDALANGGDICQLPGCPGPQVSVGEKYRISISTYSRSAPDSSICDQRMTSTYEPKGVVFELQNQHTADSRCWVGYDAGLSSALWQAAGQGETIVIVQVLPSVAPFPDRYAIALRREPTGVDVIRMEWPEKGSPYMGDLSKVTASDCFSRQASLHVKVMAMKVPEDRAEELAIALSGIDLRTDRCPRNAEGECAMFRDGREFHVEVRGHAPMDVFDLQGSKGYISENPQLSEWIYKLLDETKRATGTAAK